MVLFSKFNLLPTIIAIIKASKHLLNTTKVIKCRKAVKKSFQNAKLLLNITLGQIFNQNLLFFIAQLWFN